MLSFLVVLRTMQLGAGAAVAPGVIIHFVLGGLFAYFLLKARKEVLLTIASRPLMTKT